jgi:dTDP-4-dehydrorhamnose reductase
MLRIAVTGSHGRLGSELVRRGCLPIEADVTDLLALGDEIQAIAPDVVAHCAAYTDVDGCESELIRAARVNAEGTWLLGLAFPGKVVYLSTDYVFDGQAGPYSEEAIPNPLGIYGWSKLGGEIALRNRSNPRDLIVRTTMLFDRYSDNFVTVVAKRLCSGEPVYLPAHLVGSPTYVPHLADGILAAVEHDVSGILNLAGWRVMSRFELGRQIARIWSMDPEQIKPGPISGCAPRPLSAGLRVGKAYALGLPLGDPLDGLEEMHALSLTTTSLETMAAG